MPLSRSIYINDFCGAVHYRFCRVFSFAASVHPTPAQHAATNALSLLNHQCPTTEVLYAGTGAEIPNKNALRIIKLTNILCVFGFRTCVASYPSERLMVPVRAVSGNFMSTDAYWFCTLLEAP